MIEPGPMEKPGPEITSIREIVEPFVGRVGGLISALQAVQGRMGRLPPETEAAAAAAFNLSLAEVKGVISFYSDFHREPKGKCVIRLCAAESCQAQGARALEHEIERRFAIRAGKTSASGDLTLERVYCLGLCSAGPAAMVDGKPMAKATSDKISAAFEASRQVSK